MASWVGKSVCWFAIVGGNFKWKLYSGSLCIGSNVLCSVRIFIKIRIPHLVTSTKLYSMLSNKVRAKSLTASRR